MSSFLNPISVKSASQSGQLSSNLVMAIAPVISEALVQNMEQEKKAKMEQEQQVKDEAKKTEKSQKISSFN